MGDRITTAELFADEIPVKKRLTTAELFADEPQKDITNIYDTQQIGAKLMSGAVTPKENTGTNFLQESILKPSMSFQGGQLKSAANFADTIDHYATKIADIMGIPETSSGEVFSLRKNKILNYLKDNWNTLGDTMITKGVTPGVLQKIYEGLGSASVEVPKLMTMGKYALPISGALEGGKTGGAEGMVKGAIEGLAMKGAIGSMVNLPNALAIPAGGVALGGVPSAMQELQKPKEERDWSKPIADTVVMGALSAGGNRPTMAQFNRENNINLINKATNIYRNILRPTQGEIRKIEIRKGKDINQYYKLAAQEGLPIEKTADEKLDTSKARKQLEPKREELENTLQSELDKSNEVWMGKTSKMLDLVEIGGKVKQEMKSLYPNAEEFEKEAKKVDSAIDAEIRRYGSRYVDGSTANKIKRGFWSIAYNEGDPTTYETAQKTGHIIKESIEKAYPGQNIKELNEQAGKYATLNQLLIRAHGKVVAKGRLGTTIARATGQIGGAIAGAVLPVPWYLKPVTMGAGQYVGGAIGEKVSKATVSPERLSQKGTELAKKSTQAMGVIPYQNKPIENPFNLRNIGLTMGGFDYAKYPQKEGSFSMLTDKKPRFEIDDSKARMSKQFEIRNEPNKTINGELGAFLDHPALFKQYPELQYLDTKINIGEKSNLPEHLKKVVSKASATGSFDGKTLTVNATSPEAVKSTLLHEIQHAIQEKEGFARGGSPANFKESKNINNLLNEKQQIKDAMQRIDDKETLDRLDERLKYIDDTIDEFNPVNKYKRLAGEVESRDVSSRMDLTPEERQHTLIGSSQNIPVREQIVRFGNKGLSKYEDISKKPEQSLIETKGIPTTVPDKVKKLLQKNVSIIETGSNFQLTKAMSVKDIHGNSIDLKGGEVFTPYKLSNNQVWIHDGKDVIINKNQFQNLENQSIKGGVEFAPEMKGITESQLGGSKWQDNNLISNDETVATLVKNEDGTWSYQSDFSEGTDIFKSKVEAMKQAENDTLGQYSGRETKFSQYTLPGGENYREVLIKAPKKRGISFEDYKNKYREIYKGTPDTDAKIMGFYNKGAMIPLGNDKYAGKFDTGQEFKSSHFDEPNILTHLRINDRKTINNKKVLFVEELQSDWATEGRKKGFSDTSKKQIFSTKQEPNGEWSVVNQDGNTIITAGTKEYAERASMEYNKSGLPANLQDSRIGVPSHPLLKNWQTLALKKALKEAVDKNYDYLSWTTGAQQADRYNLAKQVDSVHYAKRENGTFDLYAVKKGSSENTKIATAIQKEKLDEYVGKNLSEKIIKGEGQDVPNTPYVKLSGEDLTIGGEWAKNLYDKQIPNILKDLTGQDVQVIKLKGIQGKHWKVWASNNPATEQPEIIRDYATAKQYMDSGYKVKEFSGDNLPQQAIKITPQIKAIIKGELKKQPSGKLPSIWEEIAKGYNKQPEENIPKFIKARIK